MSDQVRVTCGNCSGNFVEPFNEPTKCPHCGEFAPIVAEPVPVCAPSVPTEAKARKDLPVFSGVLRYFPNAILAVAQLSMIGNEQHNPGEPLHWAKEKSQDETDALARHLLDAGTRDVDKVRHSTKVAWRALANLERELERDPGGVLDVKGRTIL